MKNKLTYSDFTIGQEKIQTRISKAKKEMEYETQFDKVIVNTDLETTLQDVEKIIKNII